MNTKRTMVILLVACSIAIVSARAEECPFKWRNNNITCPERAVCGDVFVTPRELEDGTQCEEKRIINNCLCPGGSVCPFEKPSHFLYASAQQRQYTCQNICRLPYCANIRSMTPVAQTTLNEAVNFGRRTYVRMDCRCSRHHVPLDTQRTVQFSGRNIIKKTIEYVCSKLEKESEIPDPCET